MNSSTIKLLGTLEVLEIDRKLIWETATQGEFNLWNLMISEGFVNLTDIELVFEHWQNIETWGTPTNQAKYGEYAPPRSERQDGWNEEIENQRQEYYQQLQELIKTNFYNIQAYNLRVPKYKYTDDYYEWTHPDFSVSIIVAQTKDNRWCSFAPTVPNHVNYSRKPKTTLQNQSIQVPDGEIQSILNKLTSIEIYGYYYGGYDEVYEHRIISAIAESKEEVVTIALQLSDMVQIENTQDSSSGDYSQKLNQFMNQCLKLRTRYNIGFWDIAYTYEIGQTPDGDWIGTSSEYEFEYNP